MSQLVEISLRIPSLRLPAGEKPSHTIGNADVRFSRQVELERIPKPGDVLEMEVGPSGRFKCTVVRSDWHHDKNTFVVACRYANRSIPLAEYQALIDSPDWQVRALL